MKKKMVQWLYQELPDLVRAGVLTQSASDRLHEHYGDIKSTDKKWFIIIVCGVLGALLIGLGIILLFAHNWDDFSRPLRALFSLMPLVGGQIMAMWVVLKRPASYALKEGAAIFLSLMVGASIALISQTYNIPNDTPDFILNWMLLIVPLTYLMEATFPAVFFVAGMTFWSGLFWDEPLKAFLFWPFMAVVLPHLIWALGQEKYTIRASILSLVLAMGLCWGTGSTLGRTWPGSWIVIFSSLITLFYLIGVWEFKGISRSWQRPFHILGGLGTFIMMFILTFRFPWESIAVRFDYTIENILSLSAIPDHILTFVLVGSALLLFFQYVKRKDWMRAFFGALPLLALIGYAWGGRSIFFPILLFNVFMLSVSVYRLMVGIRANDLRLINIGMLMLAVLVLARFFDSDINFIIKGSVFIVIGMGFLVTNFVILRRKGGFV